MISAANDVVVETCNHAWTQPVVAYQYADERWHITEGCTNCGKTRALGLDVSSTTPWTHKEPTP